MRKATLLHAVRASFARVQAFPSRDPCPSSIHTSHTTNTYFMYLPRLLDKQPPGPPESGPSLGIARSRGRVRTSVLHDLPSVPGTGYQAIKATHHHMAKLS